MRHGTEAPETQGRSGEMKTTPRKRYSSHSLSRWGEGDALYDDVARQLNGDNRCCGECGASTSIRLLRDGMCPDCNGDARRMMGADYENPFLEAAGASDGHKQD